MINLFAEAPALPLHTAGKYVAGAYIVFALILVIYISIMANRLRTNQAELQELKRMVDERDAAAAGLAGPAAAQADETPQAEHVA
jgi:hypothetical protein